MLGASVGVFLLGVAVAVLWLWRELRLARDRDV
jgi:hypothetical protein